MLKPEIVWLVAGIILVFLELAIPGVILVFFGAGAILTALLTWIGVLPTTIAQLICFCATSLILLFALRRTLSRHFRGEVRRGGRYDDTREYLGKTARVTCRIIPGSTDGRIDFEGTEWKAVADEEIGEGSSVEILEKDNITFKVRPLLKTGEV
jgi:membrane protein implicated in regulation of membrane protease activity